MHVNIVIKSGLRAFCTTKVFTIIISIKKCNMICLVLLVTVFVYVLIRTIVQVDTFIARLWTMKHIKYATYALFIYEERNLEHKV